MHLFYVDESGVEKESQFIFFSALGVKATHWKDFFKFLSDFRNHATRDFGLYKFKEWHASDFVMGRGKLGKNPIFKSVRMRLFEELLIQLSGQSYLSVLNVKCAKSREGSNIFALNCLLNRIETFLKRKNDLGIIISDAGHENEYRRLYRKLHVINMIPSMKGEWEGGVKSKNMPLNQFIEDIIFVNSAYSWPLQIVDFIAYALNRHFCANARQKSFGLHESFLRIESILCKEASVKNSLGIVEI
jgi:hypothetical protein